MKNDDDWKCRVYKDSYKDDEIKNNGKKWMQCSYCLQLYHINCQLAED